MRIIMDIEFTEQLIDSIQEAISKLERAIKKKKKDVNIDELCMNLPLEIKEIICYCRSLTFTQLPDYDYIQSLIKICMQNQKIDIQPKFTWTKKKVKKVEEVPRPKSRITMGGMYS